MTAAVAAEIAAEAAEADFDAETAADETASVAVLVDDWATLG